jgi:hypothetical protein
MGSAAVQAMFHTVRTTKGCNDETSASWQGSTPAQLFCSTTLVHSVRHVWHLAAKAHLAQALHDACQLVQLLQAQG